MKGRFPITNLSGKHETERFIRSEYPEHVPSGLDVAPWLWAHNPQLTITIGPRALPIPRADKLKSESAILPERREVRIGAD